MEAELAVKSIIVALVAAVTECIRSAEVMLSATQFKRSAQE